MLYRIREVDGTDDDIAETLKILHDLTFFKAAPSVMAERAGHWWFAYHGYEPVAFAGVCRSTRFTRPPYGYFERVGVLEKHRGNQLQYRLMRTMEARARRNGWAGIVSDTTDNPVSANNFIRAGYRTFTPKHPWSFPFAVYWRKDFE